MTSWEFRKAIGAAMRRFLRGRGAAGLAYLLCILTALLAIASVYAADLTLEGAALKAVFDSDSGALLRLERKSSGWVIERSPEPAESFRMHAPLPDRRDNFVLGREVIVTQETTYPFEEEIRIAVQADPVARFPLLLRIPAWCQGAQICVNGETVQRKLPSGDWARLDRKWGARDTVVIRLPMSVRVEFWNRQAVSVRRGPLLYTLAVQGDRKFYDKWGSFEESVSASAAWNYALVLNETDPKSSFRFVQQEVPAGAPVWKHSPVALEVEGRRVPSWTFVDDGKSRLTKWNVVEGRSNLNCPRLPERPFPASHTTERLRLVPYGFTTLRMTYLP